MPHDESVVLKLRRALEGRRGVMLRIGPEAYTKALAEPHVRPMDFTGTPLTGFVYLGPKGHASSARLQSWVERAAAFVETLPAKPARAANVTTRAKRAIPAKASRKGKRAT